MASSNSNTTSLHPLSTQPPHSSSVSLFLVGDQTSPFTQRTLFALQERMIDYQYQEASEAQKARDASATVPTDYLPFLIYKGRVVAGGSVNLIQFLEEAFPDHQPRLLSDDLIERARERLWSDYIRQYAVPLFVRALRARVNSLRVDAAAIAGLGKVLDTYSEACLGPLFSGDQLSLPDILVAPFISQTRLSAIPRPVTAVSRLVDSAGGKRYQGYAERLLGCPSLRAALPKKEASLELLGVQMQTMARRLGPSPTGARLPPELVTQIVDEVRDYELAETLGVAHHVPATSAWTELATPLDRAILSGRMGRVVDAYTTGARELSTWGARTMVRFGYIEMLDYLLSVEPVQLHRLCDMLLPDVASAWGRVNVLEWARSGQFGIAAEAAETALNEASANGHVATLEWWKHSGVVLQIGNVMDYASLDSSCVALDWWATSGLEGKYTRAALYYATIHAHMRVLDWWLHSGLQLVYDKEVLIGASRHGRVESLEWWLTSQLPVQYTVFDIEEAIEDCHFQREPVKQWWLTRGVGGAGNACDWTETRWLGRSGR